MIHQFVEIADHDPVRLRPFPSLILDFQAPILRRKLSGVEFPQFGLGATADKLVRSVVGTVISNHDLLGQLRVMAEKQRQQLRLVPAERVDFDRRM